MAKPMGRIHINILAPVYKITSVDHMLDIMLTNERKHKLVHCLLEIVQEDWGIIPDSPMSIGKY
jgi:hypothetical protein